MQYVAGLDKDFMYNIPLNAKIDVDILNKNLSLTLMPMSDKSVRMVQTLVRPYTSIHDFLNVEPVLDSRHTNLITLRPTKQVRNSNCVADFHKLKGAEFLNITTHDSIALQSNVHDARFN
jgi:hypothetical protein